MVCCSLISRRSFGYPAVDNRGPGIRPTLQPSRRRHGWKSKPLGPAGPRGSVSSRPPARGLGALKANAVGPLGHCPGLPQCPGPIRPAAVGSRPWSCRACRMAAKRKEN